MALIGTVNTSPTSVTTSLGYTPANKVGDTITGTLIHDSTNVRKYQAQDSTTGAIKYVEDIHMLNDNSTSQWYKINVGSYYYTSNGQGCNLNIQVSRFTNHATQSRHYEYRLYMGTGQGSDPAGVNLYWYTVKEVAVGWSYYSSPLTVRLYYPSGGTNREFLYLKAEMSGTMNYNYPHYVRVSGVAVPSSLPVLEYLGTSAPTLTNYTEKTSDGTW